MKKWCRRVMSLWQVENKRKKEGHVDKYFQKMKKEGRKGIKL